MAEAGAALDVGRRPSPAHRAPSPGPSPATGAPGRSERDGRRAGGRWRSGGGGAREAGAERAGRGPRGPVRRAGERAAAEPKARRLDPARPRRPRPPGRRARFVPARAAERTRHGPGGRPVRPGPAARLSPPRRAKTARGSPPSYGGADLVRRKSHFGNRVARERPPAARRTSGP